MNEFATCGCGRPTQYLVGKDVYACNKHLRCPTYAELDRLAKDRYLEISRLRGVFRDAISMIEGKYKQVKDLEYNDNLTHNDTVRDCVGVLRIIYHNEVLEAR